VSFISPDGSRKDRLIPSICDRAADTIAGLTTGWPDGLAPGEVVAEGAVLASGLEASGLLELGLDASGLLTVESDAAGVGVVKSDVDEGVSLGLGSFPDAQALPGISPSTSSAATPTSRLPLR
jgi:hypothetical protein